MPVQPTLPSIGHSIGRFNAHYACALPMSAPPCCRMKTPQIRRPPFAKMFGHGPFNFLYQSRTRYADLAPRFHETCEVVQVEVIRPVVDEGVDADNGVEEILRERKGAGIGMDGEHAIFQAGIADPLYIFGDAAPKVGGPNLNAEFATEEDG